MSVDTARMREVANNPAPVSYLECDDYLRSAADELDELRELNGSLVPIRQLNDACTSLLAERAAHESTKRELEATRTVLSARIKAHDEAVLLFCTGRSEGGAR